MSWEAWMWLTNCMWVMTLAGVIITHRLQRAEEYYRGLVDGIDVANGRIHLEIDRDPLV